MGNTFNSIDRLKLEIPEECPMCHHNIKPEFIIGYSFETVEYNNFRIVFSCPRKKCSELFFGVYFNYTMDIFNGNVLIFKGCSPFKFINEEFSDIIKNISSNFVEIYNQAKHAESRKLNQICGLGYRKSLEFLIKDYLIFKFPEDSEAIKNNHRFDKVIDQYVTDDKIKFIARRATWLGNDHAHYTQLWADMDIEDLKTLIKASIYWISAEIEFEHYKEQMKDGRK